MQSEAVKKLEIVKLVLKAASEDVRPAEPHWHNDFLAMAVKRIEEVQALAAQSPASAVEVIKDDDVINAMILNLSRPAEGEHDPFLAAKTSFAIKAVEAIERSGWCIVKSPEGV